MSVIGGVRQKLTQVVENGHAVTRLVARGFIEPLDLGATVQTAKLAATYGPQATMAIQGGASSLTALTGSTEEEQFH